MGFKDIQIKNEYRSLIDDVVNDFYIPLLGEAVLYQRAVGFFSSSALAMISQGIEGLVQNGGKIQIIASPKLSAVDIEEIRKGYEVRQVIEKALIRELEIVDDQVELEKLSFIARLVADSVLDIKIAFLTTKNEIAMYHEKMGLITDVDSNTVAFSGSMNESVNAFRENYESFDTFCSWTNDFERVFQKQMAFKAIWEDYEPGVETLEFPVAAKERLYEYNPDFRKAKVKNAGDNSEEIYSVKEKRAIYLPGDFKIREYQKMAIKSWESKNFCGIYDMATGTGKTLTALASVEYLFRKNGNKLAIVIICPYQHLVEQWVEDIVKFGIHPIIGYSASSQKNWKKRLEQAIRSFSLGVSETFCFVTTNASFATKRVQEQVTQLNKDALLIVDEAHNMGAESYRRCLSDCFEFRLALSATIDRHNDEIGTVALTSYFGDKCIQYSLKDAIENRMLTRYFYYPVLTYLDEDELEEYLTLTYQMATALMKKGRKEELSEYAKQLLIKRSRVIAGARGKISELKKQIMPFRDDKHLLVYCGATTIKEADIEDINFGTRQIDLVTELLGNELDMRVGRFTSQESALERSQIRAAFAEGEMLQALVAIKCLDEGVNIPSIKTAFILASSTNPKEYIQRRGRVLRKFPGKDFAEIYDFITLPFPVESLGFQNQEVINSTKGLIKREIIRMSDFAEIAENPSESYDLIYDLKHGFGITEKDLKKEEVGSDVI